MSAVFLKILNMSISASWIATTVLLLRLCLKRAPKWWNVLLWGLVAVRLMLPVSIESSLSLLPRAEVVSPAHIVPSVPGKAAPMIGGAAAIASGAKTQLPIWTILAWVWLFGVLVLVLYTLVSTLRLRHQVREAVRLQGNIYQSEQVASPFVLGILRPKVYLPYHMDSREAQHVLAHEQAHLRRGDHFWKPLGFLLLTIHWFNPLMWLSYAMLCRDIELACDETVIRDLRREERADYMQALVACSVNRRRIAACPLAFGETGVKERVKSVMNYKKPTLWVMLLALALCVVLAGCFLTDPKDTNSDRTAATASSSEEADPDTADSAPEESAQPAEQDALRESLSTTESDSLISDERIGQAVLEHYADTVQDGQIHVESHAILAQDDNDGMLTVYLLVLQETYSVDGETLTLENGSYVPTAITFSIAASGDSPLEYWEPSDGSYTDDIRAKFPAAAADEALNDQDYIEDLKTECYLQAVEAMKRMEH